MDMKFKQFEIREPALLGEPPTEDYYKYNFDVVKWWKDDEGKEWCFTIAQLKWDEGEYSFRFESVLTRYLEEREDGLEEWLLKWCELKKIEYEYEEEL